MMPAKTFPHGVCARCRLQNSMWLAAFGSNASMQRTFTTTSMMSRSKSKSYPGQPRRWQSRDTSTMRAIASQQSQISPRQRDKRRLQQIDHVKHAPAAIQRFDTAMKYTWRLLDRYLSEAPETVAKGLAFPKHQILAKYHHFKLSVTNAIHQAIENPARQFKEANPLFFELWTTFEAASFETCYEKTKYLFLDWIISARFDAATRKHMEKLADCQYPSEWFPATRAMQRKIVLHVGPTNSGKTHQALQRLEQAESGIFAGPLRLLAHEVYTRFNAKGKKCSLITGEEQRIPEGLTKVMSSCTVEMAPLNTMVDVAVIDEVQMMGDEFRGWAWTQAILGIMAKELHLCGEPRTVPLIKELCGYIGDELEIREYQRLSPLAVENRSLNGEIGNLQKGDALVVFSRSHIHALKSIIEEKHPGKQCAVVYGSLPPEVRAQQAALFNEPKNNVDFLCASDAIGMGLNLSIKRVVFESVAKYNGRTFQFLEVPHTKQIAGRAGRFKTAHQAVHSTDSTTAVSEIASSNAKPAEQTSGTVTTFGKFDLSRLKWAMQQDIQPLRRAMIYPPADTLIRFANFFPPETPFSYILNKFRATTVSGPCFEHASYDDHVLIADAIQDFDLTLNERLTFTSAPTTPTPENIPILKAFASRLAAKSNGALLNIPEIRIEVLDRVDTSKATLRDLETLHSNVVTYLWLSYRFKNIFLSRALGFHICKLVEEKIQRCLATVGSNPEQIEKMRIARERALKREARREMEKKALEEVEDVESPGQRETLLNGQAMSPT